jgi:serine phosphatase RsbU (regulator of sigma subunit)
VDTGPSGAAAFTLVIASPAYRRRAEGVAGAFGQDSVRVADAFAEQAVVILRFLNQLNVERAQLAQERAVAAELQRSLLPTIPDIDGITAAARYLVSGSAAQVGGDWYDLFALPDGAIGVAIGDVMGHDVTAAASMASCAASYGPTPTRAAAPPGATQHGACCCC